MAQETRRLLEAAAALHAVLHSAGVPHAFHGDFLVALLSSAPQCEVRLACHTTCPRPLIFGRRYFASSRGTVRTRIAVSGKRVRPANILLPGRRPGQIGLSHPSGFNGSV